MNTTQLIELASAIKNKALYVIDIGASSGVPSDPVYSFITDSNYKGLCIEGEPTRCDMLRANIPSTFNIYNGFITPENVIDVFESFNVPLCPDILKIDIDGYDLEVIRTILTKYKPAIIVAEINEKMPPPILFEVLYHREYRWDNSHLYGASITSYANVMTKHQYKVLNTFEMCNIVCINHELCDTLHVAYETDIPELYKKEYILQNDRLSIFPWNENINHWLDIKDPETVKNAIIKYFETENERSHFGKKTKQQNIDFSIGY